jgi:sugar phosphate permease
MTSAPQPAVPLAARFLPRTMFGRPVFYGWYIAIACAVLMFVGVGVGYYGLPIFLRPLKEEHGWSTGQVSWAGSIYFLVSGLTGAVIGPFIDRYGPKRFMLGGMIINGLSGAAIGFVDSLWQLYAVYFVFALGFGLSSSVAVQAIMTRWFVRKRALATSISSTGVSLGGMLIAPLASGLIDAGGLALATPILGALVLAVGIPVAVLVLAWDPEGMGLHPDGDDPAKGPPPAPRSAALSEATQLRQWSRNEAMRTVSFWAVLFAFLLILTSQTGYIFHQVAFLEDRFGSRSEAAFTISVTALGSVIARLVVGIFADNVDRRLLSALLFIVQGTCILLITQIENTAATWVLTLMFGFTIGNVYMMQSLIVGEIFGMVSFASVFGLVSLAGQAGSALGPIGVGLLHDRAESYTVPFTVLATLTYVAAAVVLAARPVGGSEQTAASHRPAPISSET